MLDEGVVQAVQDIDLCMLLGAGWPFWLGGISAYLDRAGVSEAVTGERFLPRGRGLAPRLIDQATCTGSWLTIDGSQDRVGELRRRQPLGNASPVSSRRLQVAEDPRPAAATHRAELVVARRHGGQARHAGQLVGDGQPADAVLTGPSISQVSRLKPSAAAVGSMSIRQVCTSRRGGSTSTTSPSTMTSGMSQPIAADACFISSVANDR